MCDSCGQFILLDKNYLERIINDMHRWIWPRDASDGRNLRVNRSRPERRPRDFRIPGKRPKELRALLRVPSQEPTNRDSLLPCSINRISAWREHHFGTRLGP